MVKSLNELSRDLKEFIIEIQSDAHNVNAINKYRYNNLKVRVADPRVTEHPEVIITSGMSEVTYHIETQEKIKGSLGPDERYVFRWLRREHIIKELKEIYLNELGQVGKAYSQNNEKPGEDDT